jgi:hypothetical protein
MWRRSCCANSWNRALYRHLTVREIAEECNILIGSCHDILTAKLEMHRVVSKFVPRLVTQDHRDSPVAICQELLDRASED